MTKTCTIWRIYPYPVNKTCQPSSPNSTLFNRRQVQSSF